MAEPSTLVVGATHVNVAVPEVTQVSENAVDALTETLAVPERASVPDQPVAAGVAAAVQLCALVVLHVSVTESGLPPDAGVALRDTVGGVAPRAAPARSAATSAAKDRRAKFNM
jgi:hypothetical protein